jgi:hypothetical protein
MVVAAVTEEDKVRRISDGKLTQQETVDDRENPGIRTNTERQRRDSRKSDDRSTTKTSKGQAHVLPCIFKLLSPAGASKIAGRLGRKDYGYSV